MDRRRFTRTLAALGAVVAMKRPGGPDSRGPLPVRRLGATGLDVPILGLGGHHLGLAGSAAAAHRLVDVALDEGIRFFDTAESYQSGGSERWLGKALAGRRDGVVLMSKTFAFPERTAASGVFISCAMHAVRRPSEAIFSASKSFSWFSFNY